MDVAAASRPEGLVDPDADAEERRGGPPVPALVEPHAIAHLHRPQPGGGPHLSADVLCLRLGHQPRREPAGGRSAAELRLLGVEEEVLVPGPDGGEAPLADRHDGTGGPVGRRRLLVRGDVGHHLAEQRVASGPRAPEQRLAEGPPDGRPAPEGARKVAVGVEQPRYRDADPVASQGPEEMLDAAARGPDVGVHHDDGVGVGGRGGDPRVDPCGVALVAIEGDEGRGRREPADDIAGVVGGSVVDEHELVAHVRQAVGQRRDQAGEQRRAVVRDDDHRHRRRRGHLTSCPSTDRSHCRRPTRFRSRRCRCRTASC